MHYQKLLSEAQPYVAQLFSACVFPLHKHCELEFICCMEGSFWIFLDQERYTVNPGETVVIPPMCAHKADCEPNTRVLLIKVGSTLFGSRFSAISHLMSGYSDFLLNEGNMSCVLKEIAEFCHASDPILEMKIIGDIYKLCAVFLEQQAVFACQDRGARGDERRFEDVFQYVFANYSSPIAVEAVARLSGYSVGNFCRRFKLETGKTFHTYLNDYRLQKAKLLLSETSLSIESISSTVGYSETKTFCRLFKSKMGITPTEYRRSQYT